MTTGNLNRWCLLALFIGVSSPATVQAQTAPGPASQSEHEREQAPLCDPDSIDTTFTFENLPDGEQKVSLHFQNKSSAACRLHGQPSPSFAVDSHSMFVDSCWLCDRDHYPSLAPERDPGNEILLAPGKRAALDLLWDSTGPACQWADWVVFYVRWATPDRYYGYIFSPSEWPMRICSWVRSAGYWPEADSSPDGPFSDALLHVSVLQTPIYNDEWATLHVELSGQTASAAQRADCASLYTVRQGPSTDACTRLDPLRTIGSSFRPSYTPEQIKEDKEREWPSWKRDHLRTCDIPGGQTTTDADIRAADLEDVTHVEWRTASSPGENPVFVKADTHFNVLNVDTLAPNWGDPVEGIRAGLSIDKTRFSMGERVPLHLRWENVNAVAPLAQGECKEPQPALEIQDSKHNVMQTIPFMRPCSGHGWGPFVIPKGQAQRDFIELKTQSSSAPIFHMSYGTLPGPGVYYLVSVWTPHVLELTDPHSDKAPLMGAGQIGKVYATARSSPVRVEITPQDHP
jgi:hypothetical protein